MFDINGYFSWKKFGICAAIAAIAVVAIAATVVTCGAAAGIGMVVGATLTSVCSATTACTVASIATVGTYVAAGVITAGIAAYAVADIQEVVMDGEKTILVFGVIVMNLLKGHQSDQFLVLMRVKLKLLKIQFISKSTR